MGASRRTGRPWRLSLAGQMLALQLGIVLVVLAGVAAVSVANLDARNRETEGRRALSIAEYLASSPGMRDYVLDRGVGPYIQQVRGTIESTRTFTDSTVVSVALADRHVIMTTDPARSAGLVMMQQTDAFSGRAWTGTEEDTGAAMAMAPIIGEVSVGRTAGVVAVTRQYPSALDNLRAGLPNLLTYLGIASVLGVLGSLLLARRVKRQTMGMEPREITGLVEHREALLSGIKEGVIAVDLGRRITLVNDQAALLLSIPMTSIGVHVRHADPTGLLEDIFGDDVTEVDRVVSVGRRLVTVNRMPVRSRGRHIGWVVTLRDRTETLALQRELDLNKSTTDVLRSQAHEFSNRMHVVGGLIALEEYGDARDYIQQITDAQTMISSSVAARVQDPAVAALLVAKASQAGERGVDFAIAPSSAVGRLPADLSADVNTVVGNLIDNAFDAAGSAGSADAAGSAGSAGPRPTVRVEVLGDDDEVRVTVRDNGPGVGADVGERVFTRGFSTKPAEGHHGLGIGLALVRLVCRGRGGDVTVHNDDGAVFVATLPTTRVEATP